MINHKTGLITGSTSGIGKAFANLLAQKGYHLVLVSRDAEKLNIQAEQIAEEYGIKVHMIACDLTQKNAAITVWQEVRRIGVQIHILINNAGFNECGSFLATSMEKEIEMMQLHMIFTTQLMKMLLPQMVENKYGRILNVGSTGSYIPCPYNAVYAATKAYILSMSKGIASELKNTGVSITTLCPGATKTAFAVKAGIEDSLLFKLFVMSPEKVARIGYKALMKGRLSVIAGIYNKLLVFTACILPKEVVNFICKKMYGFT